MFGKLHATLHENRHIVAGVSKVMLVLGISGSVIGFILMLVKPGSNVVVNIVAGVCYLFFVPYIAATKDSPLGARFDKWRKAEYLRSTPNFVGVWNTNDTHVSEFGKQSGGYMNETFFLLLRNGASTKTAIRWVQAHYIADPSNQSMINGAFRNITAYYRIGIEAEDFARLWKLGVTDPEHMLYLAGQSNKYDIDDSILSAVA